MTGDSEGLSPCDKIPDGSYIQVTKVRDWVAFSCAKTRYLPFQAKYEGRLYHCCLSAENMYTLYSEYYSMIDSPYSEIVPVRSITEHPICGLDYTLPPVLSTKLEFKPVKRFTL
jgi:hypothetical protein